MIAFLQGEVKAIEEDNVIILTGGVGYQVFVPWQAFNCSPELGAEITVHTHLQVREDAFTLFGFPNAEHLAVFRLFLGVSGIGAKTALQIINSLPLEAIMLAINGGNVQAFQQISGIGAKTAQRIILELKDKFKKFGQVGGGQPLAAFTPLSNDSGQQAITALAQLGYPANEAKSLVAAAIEHLETSASLEAIISEALRLGARM